MSSKYFNRRIPILLIGNDYRLLKSIKFQEHLYLGDPLNALRVFSEKSIDEMVIYFLSKNDISESFSYISTLLSEVTFPLSIGGGINNIEDCIALNNLGVEKFVLTSQFRKPGLIKSIADVFGSQAASVCLNYNLSSLPPSQAENYIGTSSELIDGAKWSQEQGAGEIILQNIERDGTRLGYDLETLHLLRKHLTVQLVAAGGAGTEEDMRAAIKSGATGVCGSSMFFLKKSKQDILIRYPKALGLGNE